MTPTDRLTQLDQRFLWVERAAYVCVLGAIICAVLLGTLDHGRVDASHWSVGLDRAHATAECSGVARDVGAPMNGWLWFLVAILIGAIVMAWWNGRWIGERNVYREWAASVRADLAGLREREQR